MEVQSNKPNAIVLSPHAGIFLLDIRFAYGLQLMGQFIGEKA